MKKLIFSLVICANLYADEKSVDLLMKARGLQAHETIGKLSKKNGASKGKNLSPKELCQWYLESSYLTYSIPEFSKILIKKHGDTTKYALLISEGKDSGPQVHYAYQYKKDASPVAMELFNISGIWRASTMKELGGYIMISSDRCAYFFNTSNPLDSFSSPK